LIYVRILFESKTKNRKKNEIYKLEQARRQDCKQNCKSIKIMFGSQKRRCKYLQKERKEEGKLMKVKN